MPGSSNSRTSISITFCHNSGANTTHTKVKIFFKISPEHNLTRDAGDFIIFFKSLHPTGQGWGGEDFSPWRHRGSCWNKRSHPWGTVIYPGVVQGDSLLVFCFKAKIKRNGSKSFHFEAKLRVLCIVSLEAKHQISHMKQND